MMLSKKKMIFMLIGTTLVVGLVGCFNHSPEKRADWISSRISDKLDLNEQQQIKLNDVKTEVLLSRAAIKKNRESHFEKIMTMVKSDVLDKQAMYAIFKSKTANLEKHADPVLDKLVIFHASLSDEQKTEIAEFIEEHKNEHQGFKHH